MNLLQSLLYPAEVASPYSLVDFMLLGGKKRLFPPNELSELRPSMRRCYEFLNLTSRSFSAVIQALDPELRPAIALFYLVLRGLDTVEDDMTIDLAVKRPTLLGFHERLYERGWNFKGNGPKEKDRQLLVEFEVVVEEFSNLDIKYQVVIADITKRMGAGMMEFVDKPVNTVEDYNLYCHYVAGLVGIGLAKLFSASGLESQEVGEDTELANSMGLFLQKTNIIRDYLEDLVDGRTWYPREIWGLYANELADLSRKEHAEKALQCLNHMITDALAHIPDVFTFMSRLKNPTIFAFCAIPQVMAVSTLELLYNNINVFKGVVKIRKGLAVQLMLQSTSYPSLLAVFEKFVLKLDTKARTVLKETSAAGRQATLSGAGETLEQLEKAKNILATARQHSILTSAPAPSDSLLRVAFLAVTAAVVAYTCVSQCDSSHTI